MQFWKWKFERIEQLTVLCNCTEKYVSRQEQIKEVPRVREGSLVHRDNIGSDEFSISETPHHDDIWEEIMSIFGVKRNNKN